jgi:hypothetical protein
MSNFRVHCRVEIYPRLVVNLSQSGPGITIGVRGAEVTVGSGSDDGRPTVADRPDAVT